MGIGDIARKIRLLFEMTKCRCVEVIYGDINGNKHAAYFHRDQNIVRKLRRIHRDFNNIKILEINKIN